jgi:hypothetical protein
MAKRRHHRRRSSGHSSHRRRHNPHRVHHRRRHHAIMLGARRHHRRRNPSLRGLAGGFVPLALGGGIGYFGSRMIPASIPMLAQYNTGAGGFLLNIGAGFLLYSAAGFFGFARRFRPGILVGTAIAVAVRAYEGYMQPVAMPAPAAAVSGDLGYYVSDRFPFPQGNGGPYDPFVGTPSLSSPPFSTTSAAGVRAGQVAAAAALTPGAARGADGSPLEVNAERWGSVWR